MSPDTPKTITTISYDFVSLSQPTQSIGFSFGFFVKSIGEKFTQKGTLIKLKTLQELVIIYIIIDLHRKAIYFCPVLKHRENQPTVFNYSMLTKSASVFGFNQTFSKPEEFSLYFGAVVKFYFFRLAIW